MLDDGKIEPIGLNGWLVLPMFGLYLMPLRAAAEVLEISREFSKYSIWTTGMYGIVWWSVIVGLMTAIAAIYVISRAHKRDPIFPRAYQALWGLLFAISISWPAFAIPMAGVAPQASDWMPVFMTAIIGAVWCTYMQVSKRVYNTFLRNQMLPPRIEPTVLP